MTPTTADFLAAVVAAWDSWDTDGALRWEIAMKNAVEAARTHLAPVLVDADPAPPCRCLP